MGRSNRKAKQRDKIHMQTVGQERVLEAGRMKRMKSKKAHLTTVTSCITNLIVFSDRDENVGPQKISLHCSKIRLPEFAIPDATSAARKSHVHGKANLAREFMRRATIRPYRPYAHISFSFCVFSECIILFLPRTSAKMSIRIMPIYNFGC